MKTWDDWSDSQITIAVNDVTKKHHDVEIRKPDDDNDWIGDSAGTCVDKEVVIGWKGEGVDEEVFIIDYCNSWSDMGPIIAKVGISLSHNIARVDADSLVYDKKFDNGFHIFRHEGAMGDISERAYLRAAAIVFLEMNGVKP